MYADAIIVEDLIFSMAENTEVYQDTLIMEVGIISMAGK